MEIYIYHVGHVGSARFFEKLFYTEMHVHVLKELKTQPAYVILILLVSPIKYFLVFSELFFKDCKGLIRGTY